MSGGAIITFAVCLVILGDIAVLRSGTLWHRPEKRAGVERLESKVMLALAAACLPTIAYALTQGRLWPAATLAFGAFVMLISRRRIKQSLGREL